MGHGNFFPCAARMAAERIAREVWYPAHRNLFFLLTLPLRQMLWQNVCKVKNRTVYKNVRQSYSGSQ